MAWMILRITYFDIGYPPAASIRGGVVAVGYGVSDRPVRVLERYTGRPGYGSGRPRRGRPEGRSEPASVSRSSGDQPLRYQSPAFQVGPAWVGLAKKLPSASLTSSTFLR